MKTVFLSLVVSCLWLSSALFGEEGEECRKDLYGDGLPAGAVARLGTTRFLHEAPVTCVAFHPDGKRVISAMWNCSKASIKSMLVLWDTESNRKIRTFERPDTGHQFTQRIDFGRIHRGQFLQHADIHAIRGLFAGAREGLSLFVLRHHNHAQDVHLLQLELRQEEAFGLDRLRQ